MDGILRTGLAAVALCAMAGLTATPVDAAASSLILSLAGTVQVPPNPCIPNQTSENVMLTGNAHVVSIVPPSPILPLSQIKLHFNLADVIGTGSFTGNTYIGTGAMTFDFVPPSPIFPGTQFSPSSMTTTFSLESTVGCASTPLAVSFTLQLDPTLHLDPNNSFANFGSNTGGGP
jgi:hypothetical protein